MTPWKLPGILLLILFSLPAIALADPEPELLDPDQAFAISASIGDGNAATVTWNIAAGYYLYRDRIRFSTDTPGITLGEPVLPPGKIKDDEFFGKIATYRTRVTASIPLLRSATAAETVQLTAVSQGCADIGVCYPPHTQVVALNLPDAGAIAEPESRVVQALSSLSDMLGLDNGADDFLAADDAFQVSVLTETPDMLRVRWVIAEGYYLYRDKISIQLPDSPAISLGPPEIPEGEIKHDEIFGNVQVFHQEVEARVPVRRTSGAAAEISLQLGYQGCAEAGICYPPIKKLLPVALAATDTINSTPLQAPVSNQPAADVTSNRQDDIVRVLQESGLLWVLLFFFGAGVLLAFTACMYPMIPILSSIIVGQGEKITTLSAFILSLVYVEAVAITYAVIGLISAHLGAGVQAFFQNPWILAMFALIFVLLALSMFGFFHLQLPASWQAKFSAHSNRMRGGTLAGAAAMGVLSALIVGPCAGPVLIGALIYTSQSGDYLTGALAMFALGNGMGAPLLAICTTEGKILPRAGAWMDTVKAVFGVVLLGVAILMLERILPGPVTLGLWALLLIVPAIYMGALETLPQGVSGWRKLWKGLGIAMLVYGVILILGATTGARDPFNPLRNLTTSLPGDSSTRTSEHLQFQRIKSVTDFQSALQRSTAEGKPVMLDFYADWCTYCIKMEDYTFSDSKVQQALAGVTLLQADVTRNDATDLALLNHFNLFAPPAILFFAANGLEQRNHRLIGFLNAGDFLVRVRDAIGES
ncbi:MAG: protein-disulfide reductase DsbD [Gammaproteobacteria bacterium]